MLQFYTTDAIFRKDAVSTHPQGEAALDMEIPHEPQCSFWGWSESQSSSVSALVAPQVKFLSTRLTRLSALRHQQTGEVTRCQIPSKK